MRSIYLGLWHLCVLLFFLSACHRPQYNQHNAIWSESVYFRGFNPSTGIALTEEALRNYAVRLKTSNIQYAYIFAGPFDSSGHLPAYAFSPTAIQSIRLFKKYDPQLIVLPWIGGIQNKTVHLEDPGWVANALADTRRLITTLDVTGVHIDFECVLPEYRFIDTGIKPVSPDLLAQYGKLVNAFHKKLREELPDAFISSVVTATSPATSPWKKKTSVQELSELVGYIDQLSFLYYDTGLSDQKSFEDNCDSLLRDIKHLRQVNDRVEYLVAIGTFVNASSELQKKRDLGIESVGNSLRTIRTLLNKKEYTPQLIDGISIYCGWQTREDQWLDFNKNWGALASKRTDPIPFQYSKETDADFLVEKDGSIVAGSDLPDHFHPFLYNGKTVWLKDHDGDENFQPTDSALQRLLGEMPVEKVYPLAQGTLLVVKGKNRNELYLIDGATGTRRTLCQLDGDLNGVTYDPTDKQVIICDGSVLESIDIGNLQGQRFDGGLPGDKANLFFYNGWLYFVSNTNTEFYSIYRLDYAHRQNKAADLVLTGTHDLRMPKLRGDTLYYIEVVDNSYLLKRRAMTTGVTTTITSMGVVYNFEFLSDERVAYSYSDLNTPRTIKIYNPFQQQSIAAMTPGNVSDTMRFTVSGYSSHSSRSHFLQPDEHIPLRGIILFIHPGVHSDYSPRWDFLLRFLSSNGYLVVAPNYPMSAGCGKQYYNRDRTDALDDIRGWARWLRKQYQLPVYSLTSSSGNGLMESLLTSPGFPVAGAISLFGIPDPSIDLTKITTPTLYILGKNDPQVPWTERAAQLTDIAAKAPVTLQTLANEGHWCRRIDNMKLITQQVWKALTPDE